MPCSPSRPGRLSNTTRLLVPLDGFEAGIRNFEARRRQGLQRDRAVQVRRLQAGGTQQRRGPGRRARPTCFASIAEGWYGDNTDGSGLVHDLQVNAGLDLSGRDILLIGAGGAAAGVLGPLIEARPASAGRRQPLDRQGPGAGRPPRRDGSRLRGRAGSDGPVRLRARLPRRAQRHRRQPAGRRQSRSPAMLLAPGALAYDMMYGPPPRPSSNGRANMVA